MHAVSRWFDFKYDAGKWLSQRLFPPSRRAFYEWTDIDTMQREWDEDERWQRQNFPVRFWIERVWEFVSRWPRVSNVLYWLRTHTYNRYHILDLRDAEPENPHGYRWGWIDRCQGIVLANFLVLREFVKQEKPWDCSKAIARAEEEGDPNGELPCLRHQQKSYEECMALYRWWTADRFAEYELFEAAEEAAREAYDRDDSEEQRDLYWLAATAQDDREGEMLRRLIDLRGYLWT